MLHVQVYKFVRYRSWTDESNPQYSVAGASDQREKHGTCFRDRNYTPF